MLTPHSRRASGRVWRQRAAKGAVKGALSCCAQQMNRGVGRRKSLSLPVPALCTAHTHSLLQCVPVLGGWVGLRWVEVRLHLTTPTATAATLMKSGVQQVRRLAAAVDAGPLATADGEEGGGARARGGRPQQAIKPTWKFLSQD